MLNTFCCCSNLRLGCFIISYLHVVTLSLYLINLLIQQSYYSLQDIEIIVGVILHIALSAVFAYGVHKKKWLCIVPWLVSELIAHVTFSVYTIVFAIEDSFILMSIPFIVLGFYLCLVAYSYILELKQNKTLMQPMNYSKETDTSTAAFVVNPIWNENYAPPPPPPPYTTSETK